MSKFDLDALDEAQRELANVIESNHHKALCPFLREHGEFFKSQKLPKGIGKGQVRVCYANSYRLLKRHGKKRGLAYAEGYALTPLGEHLHAWCVDRDGNVYDPTWNDGIAYFGVAIQADYLYATIRERAASGDEYHGLLDDWRNGCPITKEQPDVWKHQWDADD